MTLHELVTRPLTHRWVAINRATELVVNRDALRRDYQDALDRESDLRARLDKALTMDVAPKTKRTRKPKVQP
jgi:hypothetical protein